MGFGLIFLGYFFLLFMPVGDMGILPNFSAIGSLLMIAARKRLVYYCPDDKSFKGAIYPLVLQTFCALALFVFGILGYGAGNDAGVLSIAVNAVGFACDVCICLATGCFMYGVRKLSREVELPKLASRSVRMLSFTAMYLLLSGADFVTELIDGFVTSPKAFVTFNYIGFAAFVLEYVFIFLCLAYFFTCYMRICLEGDEDMPYREDLFDRILTLFKRNKRQ